MKRSSRTLLNALPAVLTCWGLLASGCSDEKKLFDVEHPERGPSELLSNGDPITDGNFAGGNDQVPVDEASTWDAEPPITCGEDCLARCESLNLTNPVNKGLCTGLWGPGGSGTPIVAEEACRRLWVDTQGRFPTRSEMKDQCLDRPWGEVVKDLLSTEAFVRLNRRHWADRLGYDTESVSVERIYDMDRVVEALYEGRIAYDEFAAVLSAHPILTRRHATRGDRAEALFWVLLGRPPFGDERSDLGRMYTLWDNNYYDHPQLGMRLPDAYIRYRCVDDEGRQSAGSGECTSVRFGHVETIILEPDSRARKERDGWLMWSGLLTASEWEKLQTPGRLLTQDWLFWEHAANVVIDQYLGYDLATQVPQVGEELVRYALDNNGDIRSLHYAILTSAAYLQSSTGDRDAKLRYTYGPLKQIDAEGWVDSLNAMTDSDVRRCDLRINRPGDFLDSDSPSAYALLQESDWQVNDEGRIDTRYRDLVRNLGGCPDNSQGGRFKIVSVLTTANQLNFATRICDPALEGGDGRRERASIEQLLPKEIGADESITADSAAEIVRYQMLHFFGRSPTGKETEAARAHGESCARSVCRAEEFARPACYALLSSAEMLFY